MRSRSATQWIVVVLGTGVLVAALAFAVRPFRQTVEFHRVVACDRLAWLGLGLALWALLAGWWDGWFMLAFRTFAWMFLSVTPVDFLTDALAYGPPTGTALVVDVVFGVFATAVAGGMLFATLSRW